MPLKVPRNSTPDVFSEIKAMLAVRPVRVPEMVPFSPRTVPVPERAPFVSTT